MSEERFPLPCKLTCRLLVAVLFGACSLGTPQLRAEPLEQWHWRNPLPQGNALHSLMCINGNWLSVGELGTVLSSTDGTNWLRRESGVSDTLRGCAYGAGHYVIVGDFGTVLTSSDGVEWTPQYAGTFYSLNSVTYGDGQFVAVGEETTILTSPDGVEWAQHSSGDWDLFQVIWAEGIYVAAGGQRGTSSLPALGVILTSPDGRVWTRRAFTPEAPFSTVAYGDRRFVACGSGGYQGIRLWTSDDGLTWNANNALGFYGESSLLYTSGKWLLGTANPYFPGGDRILTSTDLWNWSEVVTNSPSVTGIALGNGQFIASRIDGTFLVSSNGMNWANPAPAPLAVSFGDLEYINGSFVGIGYQQLAFSKDGTVWTNVVAVTNTETLGSITYGNGRYVAGGEYRTVWTSTDGVNWTNPAPDLSIKPYVGNVVVAYGNGVFVGAAGYAGDILTSPDGLNWTVQRLETNAYTYVYFRDITFGNGRFAAVSERAIATSTDGTNWYFNDAISDLVGVACGNGRFVAVGNNTISTSVDGTNWFSQTSSSFGPLTSVAFGAGLFVATASAQYYTSVPTETPIWVSPDGLHWSSRHSHTSRPLSPVVFGNGTFVLNGGGGALLQSDPLVRVELTSQLPPQLLLSGPLDRSYRIEYTESLGPSNRWMELGTVRANETPTPFNDLSWTNSCLRLYRAVLMAE